MTPPGAPSAGVNDRRAARPITLSPSNAHSRAAIGPVRTPPAPDWPPWRCEPRPLPPTPTRLRAPRSRAGPSVLPGIRWAPGVPPEWSQSGAQAHPRPSSPAQRAHVAPRLEGVGGRPREGAGGGRGLSTRRVRVRLRRFRATGPQGRGTEAGGGGAEAPLPAPPSARLPRPARPRAGSRRLGGARHHPTAGGAPGPGAQPRRSLAWAAQPSCQPMWRVRAGTAAVK